MANSVDIVKRVFERQSIGHLPKGELWLGTDLFRNSNLPDDLKGHLTLVKRLGHDLLCLPISHNLSMNKPPGYRYFSLKDLEEASKVRDLFLIAVVDGPFQRLAEKRGLMNILSVWKREKDEIAKRFEDERKEVDILIKQCLELSVDALIIAEDLAGEKSLFVDPDDIQAFLSIFYIQSVSQIHKGHSYALFHSCGNITRLIPQLVSYGFDGLAAIQHRANDLVALMEKYGSTLTLMAGIDVEMLERQDMPLSCLKEYERLVRGLSRTGGFILCSSCGLYSADFVERIEALYRIADEVVNIR